MAGYDFEFYETGMISVTAGQKAFTGSGTAWKIRGCEGALVIVSGAGAVNFVSTLDTDAAGEFRTAWTGPTLANAQYTMWLPSAVAATALANHQRLAEIIASIQDAQPESGNLTALADLAGDAETLVRFLANGSFDLVKSSDVGIRDPNGSVAKLAELTLAVRQILQTDDTGALKAIALAANKFLRTDANGDIAQSNITPSAVAMLASNTPAVTSLGYTPVNRSGDTGMSGTFATTGKVVAGNASPVSTPDVGTPSLQGRGQSGSHCAGMLIYPGSTEVVLAFFNTSFGISGSIKGDGGSGVQYLTSSDYRLKYDVEPLVSFTLDSDDFESLSPALLRVLLARPVRYKWVGGSGDWLHGFIAHELQPIAPHAVSGSKDETAIVGVAVDSENITVADNITEVQCPDGATWVEQGTVPIHQKVDHSRLVADLYAAVQELTTIVLEQGKQINALIAADN